MTRPPHRSGPARALRASILLAVLFAFACAGAGGDRTGPEEATPNAPDVPRLGLLDDYSQLAPGHKGQASLLYISDDADFSDYTGIFVEPVAALPLPGDAVSQATRDLAASFDASLRRELANEFDLVDAPRAGSMRLRTGLASKGGADMVLEIEVLDGGSGDRLVAVVDDRQLEGPSQIEAWSGLITRRLAVFRDFHTARRARKAGAAP